MAGPVRKDCRAAVEVFRTSSYSVQTAPVPPAQMPHRSEEVPSDPRYLDLLERYRALADRRKATSVKIEALRRQVHALGEELVAVRVARNATGLSEASLAVSEARRRWTPSVTQPMLLISQVQRSGGTLLARLFDGHPACFAHPSELQWGRPAKWNWPAFSPEDAPTAEAALALLQERWPRKFTKAGGYFKYSDWTRTQEPERVRLYPFVYDRALAAELFSDRFAARPDASRRALLNAYLTSLFGGWLDYQNLHAGPKAWVTAFVARLVMHEDSVARFFEDYPDGRLVTIVRNPQSWYASAIRHRVAEDPSAALPEWTASTQASLAAAAAYGDRVRVVVFDDLVMHTEATMRGLCDWMGLAFSDGLLQPTYNGMPVLSDSSYELRTDIDTSTTTRFRQVLARNVQDRIEADAVPLYREVVARFGLRD